MKLPPRCGNRLLSFALGAAPSVAGFDGSIGDSAGGGTVRVVAMVKACAFGDGRAIVLSDRCKVQVNRLQLTDRASSAHSPASLSTPPPRPRQQTAAQGTRAHRRPDC